VKPRPDLPGGPWLVVGMARSGIAAALALRARGEQVIGVDAGSPKGMDALAGAGVELHENVDGVALLDRARAVVKSPGVPAQAPVIAAAHARGIEVLGELELGWRMLSNEFVVVTGTNGKTTTVELIGHIHREAGLPVAVAGNVGTAVSELVGKVDGQATVVCEASSFQLEDTRAFAPEAAVLLNITPDHLDRHGTFAAYRDAKLQIFVRQGNEDIAVAPTALREGSAGRESETGISPIPGCGRLVSFGEGVGAALSLSAGQLWWDERALLGVEEIRLPGRHNVENAMAAAAVCLARGIDVDAVRAGLRSFAGVRHRLEEVASGDGVRWVNDSKATNVASTVVALDAMGEKAFDEDALADAQLKPREVNALSRQADNGSAGKRAIHVILGGQGKGQDFAALRGPVERSCRAVYLIGEDAPKIAAALAGLDVLTHECGDLERAVSRAREAASPGDVVLLSPACASFDQFADYEARGERFRELVEHPSGSA
jgi:UDP-N-acetylmuramoylalanine--D-glutamate ligase